MHASTFFFLKNADSRLRDRASRIETPLRSEGVRQTRSPRHEFHEILERNDRDATQKTRLTLATNLFGHSSTLSSS